MKFKVGDRVKVVSLDEVTRRDTGIGLGMITIITRVFEDCSFPYRTDLVTLDGPPMLFNESEINFASLEDQIKTVEDAKHYLGSLCVRSSTGK